MYNIINSQYSELFKTFMKSQILSVLWNKVCQICFFFQIQTNGPIYKLGPFVLISEQEKSHGEELVDVPINPPLENIDSEKEDEYESSEAGGKRKRNPAVRVVYSFFKKFDTEAEADDHI